MPGGYDVDGGVEIAQYLESTGLIDYVHGVVGSAVGQPQLHPADLLRARRSSVRPGRRADSRRSRLPGGPHRPDQPAPTSPSGSSPPATPTSSAWPAPTSPTATCWPRPGRAGRRTIRPCVGGNECISRRYVEGLPFGCAVNPTHQPRGRGPVADGLRRPPAARRRRWPGRAWSSPRSPRETGLTSTLWEADGRTRRAAALRRPWRPGTRCTRPTCDWQGSGCATSASPIKLGHRAHGRRGRRRWRGHRGDRDRRDAAPYRHPRRRRAPRVVDIRDVLAGRVDRRRPRPGRRAGRPRGAAVGGRPPGRPGHDVSDRLRHRSSRRR